MRELENLPRLPLTLLPTPLIELRRLADVLGGPRILMKRDDLTGLGLGGNKTRKLEFLLGEARAQGCDTVVTGGAAQSNHSRQTAAAAAAAGLECHLALGGVEPDLVTGNLLLDRLFGATVHWCGDQIKGERIPEIARILREQGRKPYIIPFGGSNAVGALGFVAAADELGRQLAERGQTVDCLILPSSSGGTQAGLGVGLDLYGLQVPVVGIGIDRGEPGNPAYEADLADLANACARHLGRTAGYRPADFRVRYDFFGGGYGVLGQAEREAMQLVGETEGILLDPVYSGRAMAGLLAMIRAGEFGPNDTVLFWHTGGTPAVFEYAPDLALGPG